MTQDVACALLAVILLLILGALMTDDVIYYGSCAHPQESRDSVSSAVTGA
jgi:hypothetical protein